MNPFEFVLIIISMVFGLAIIMKRMDLRHGRGRRHGLHLNLGHGEERADQENQRLRQEVSELKERLKVLERITVEKENSLDREIEKLRDR